MQAHPLRRSASVRRSRCFGWLLIPFGFSLPAGAAGGLSDAAKFDISPQRLPTAVLRYSEQSGVQVTSPAELLAGRDSPGVKGSFSARRALTDRKSVG